MHTEHMALEDIPAHLRARAETLVKRTKVQLAKLGIDTTGMLPVQVRKAAQDERRKSRYIVSGP